MSTIRDAINSILFEIADLLAFGGGVLMALWASRWLTVALVALVVVLAVALRKQRAGLRERRLIQTAADRLGHATSPDELVAILFESLFEAVQARAAGFYVGASVRGPFRLEARRSNEPGWAPEPWLKAIPTEVTSSQKNPVVVSIPVRIQSELLALLQIEVPTVRDAVSVRACADFLRSLVTPVVAQYATARRIQRLEEQAMEASVVSGATQSVLNTTLGPAELASLLLDLIVRATGSQSGLILLAPGVQGRPADGVLASIALAPDRLQELMRAIGVEALPVPQTLVDLSTSLAEPMTALRTAGFRALLRVPIGPPVAALGAIVLLKRDEPFAENHVRICQLNAGRLALTLKNRAYHEAAFGEYREMLLAMVATHEAGRPYLEGHSGRVARLAGALVQHFGLGSEEAAGVELAAQLHDIGMIGLGGDLLVQARRLTPQEYDVVKYHPVIGAALTTPFRLPVPIAPMILHHHERYDGLGYPAGLKGAEIPFGARILGVAEVFDALMTPRNYRPALACSEALVRLRLMAGTQLDPRLVEIVADTITEETWRAIATADGSRSA